VGWQDRDYAKLTAAELKAIYGGPGRPTAPMDRNPLPADGSRTFGQRQAVWPGVALLILAALGYAWLHHSAPASRAHLGQPSGPVILFGTAVTSGPFAGSVCTEMEYVAASVSWRCDDYQVNTSNLPVHPAAPYNGSCAHLRVDGTAWVCLSGVPASGGTS
jgi:hypothetical protein